MEPERKGKYLWNYDTGEYDLIPPGAMEHMSREDWAPYERTSEATTDEPDQDDGPSDFEVGLGLAADHKQFE